MSGLIKGRIYKGEDNNCVRLGAFIDNEDKAFVTDIKKLESSYMDLASIREYQEITAEQMLDIIDRRIPDWKSLSAEQKQIARRRYAIISPLLDNLQRGEEYLHLMIKDISEVYKVRLKDVLDWLSIYCAFGSLSCLVRPDEIRCSVKPILKVREYNNKYKEVGSSLLINTKISSLNNNKTVWLNILYDTETHYVMSYDVSTDEDSYSSIKSLLHRSLSENGGILPFKIYCQVTNRTWNSYLRNIQLLGVELNYCHPFLDEKELKRLINSIKAFGRGLNNIDALKARIKGIIDSYNNDQRDTNYSYKELFNGLLEALYDSCIKTTDGQLENVLSRPYKQVVVKNN